MRHRCAVVFVACASTVLPTVPVEAGPCAQQIAEVENALPPETTGSTKRGSEQTQPQAVRRETAAEAALARARRFDAEGRRVECLNALAEARRLLR